MTLVSLAEFVERFEEARWRHGQAGVADFLPEPSHPLYLKVLCELVRIEMEHTWQPGRPNSLESYRRRFPDLFADPTCSREIEFEEHRLRTQAHCRQRSEIVDSKDTIEPDLALTAGPDWQRRKAWAGNAMTNDSDLDGAAERSSVVADLDTSDPETADRLPPAASNWPAVGSSFLDFRLLRELGRGAFARVYLAQQEDSANRPVALKLA